MNPERLRWENRPSLGVIVLDNAHRELLDLYNRIADASNQGEPLPGMREKVRTFLVYARWHFAEEEAFMIAIGYSGYVDHRADHQRLLQDADDFVANLGEALHQQDCGAVAAYFQFWLSRHAAQKDRALEEYISRFR